MLPRLVALIALAAVLAGCGFKEEPIGPLPLFPQTARDSLGREVRIDVAPQRIVSLDPGMTATVFALGAGKLVEGRSGRETYPKGALKPPVMITPQGEPDIKALRRAKPDLILAPATLVPTKDDANRLALRIGANVYVVRADSVDGVREDILELGLMTGRAERSREVVAGIDAELTRVRDAVAGLPKVPAFVDAGFRYTIGPDDLPADLLRLAGGVNVAADARRGTQLTVADLRTAAPEAWISIKGQGLTPEELKSNPGLKNLPAVQSGTISEIDRATLFDDGPRVARSLVLIATAIHPDLQL
ncbi:MAG: cobalamin transport system substrate-binding protein [Gaiellales bacterium]|nr:cobalamin transport system substrate-binding protein [Gaiellales bacterium]